MVLGSLLAIFWLMISNRFAGKNSSISPKEFSGEDFSIINKSIQISNIIKKYVI